MIDWVDENGGVQYGQGICMAWYCIDMASHLEDRLRLGSVSG